MNRTVLNGAILGQGTSDARSLIASSVRAVASAVSTVTVCAWVVSSAIAKATTSSATSVFMSFKSSASASSTSLSNYVAVGCKFILSAVRATASAQSRLDIFSGIKSTVTAVATSVSDWTPIVGSFLSSDCIAKAVSNSLIFKQVGFNAIGYARAIPHSILSIAKMAASHVFAVAESQSSISQVSSTIDSDVDIERIMVVENENRTMELSE